MRVQPGFKERADTWVGPYALRINVDAQLLLVWTYKSLWLGEILQHCVPRSDSLQDRVMLNEVKHLVP